jgi:hypothetical protein
VGLVRGRPSTRAFDAVRLLVRRQDQDYEENRKKRLGGDIVPHRIVQEACSRLIRRSDDQKMRSPGDEPGFFMSVSCLVTQGLEGEDLARVERPISSTERWWWS